MCGIVGYVGRQDAWPLIYAGLQRLEYRGYDSAGIAVVDHAGRLHISRTVGKVRGLLHSADGPAPQGALGLGHTRWATHGRPSYDNAHPHTDCRGRIALVHNGIVENYQPLKRRLTEQGHLFRSETDSEVLAHLVEEGLEQGLDFAAAFRRMAQLITGSQAIAATLQDGDGPICAVRVGYAGGLLVAHYDGQGVVGSDLPALLPLLEPSGNDAPPRPGAAGGRSGGAGRNPDYAGQLADTAAYHSDEAGRNADYAGQLADTAAHHPDYAGQLPDTAAHHPDSAGQLAANPAAQPASPVPFREWDGRGVAFLENGEMAVVSREGVAFSDLAGNAIAKQPRPVAREAAAADRGGYRHYMLKEIMEQPQAMLAALRGRVNFAAGRVELPELAPLDAQLPNIDRVALIGCGTSLHAAQVGRHLVERLSGMPAEAESASEFRYRDPYLGPRTLVVSIGQSGETADTIAAMQLAKEKGAPVITICNAEDSQAARLADAALPMRAGLEIGVASTKTFIASLTILNLLALYLGQRRGMMDAAQRRELLDGLARGPRLLGELLADAAPCEAAARRFNGFDNFLFLGRGSQAHIAQEGALKLKEITYIHAEGYPAGEMKHGPIALIDAKMATVALAPRDALYDKVANNIKEVQARDGQVLAVLTAGDRELAPLVDAALFIPEAPPHLTPILITPLLQLLSYHIAVRRGCDVDQPRNLAKSVTVE